MTATKFAGYSYDAISNTLTMTAAFAKKASQLNTPEYHIVRQLRLDNPGMKIEKSAAKDPTYRPLNNYANYSERPEFDTDGGFFVSFANSKAICQSNLMFTGTCACRR